MATFLRILRLLSIVVWVGGIIFFAFVLAPVAFHLLPSQHLAGIVVGGTLRVLDMIGGACGLLFWAATALLWHRSAAQKRYGVQILLVVIMLILTKYLHTGILPAMEVDRTASGGDIETASATNPDKIHFERLHKRSEQVEGAVLLCGLGVVILMAGESLPKDTIKL